MFSILVLTCAFLYAWFRIRKGHPPFPPGPPADPLLGHLRLIPPNHQDMLFYQWGKIYGDVIHLQFLGRSVIVLNSVKAAVDLLDKRSTNYSDRPRFYIFELMGWVSTLSFIQYGRKFQRHRRLCQNYLMPSKCLEYRAIQSRETKILLQNLMSNSDNYDAFLRRFSTAIIMQVAYGHQIMSDDDPYVKIAQESGYALSNAGSPGSTPIDFFPFLQHLPFWFPGTYYAKFARDNRFMTDSLHDYPFQEVTRQMAEGVAKPSFLSTQLETMSREGRNYPNTVEDIKGVAGVMYCAGADTTWSTLAIFVLSMVLHPDHQARAQREIDAVIGPGRLPEFDDRASLPYVECILQETLRWNSAVPSGVPHRSLADDVYNGMFIPKGSLIIANTRGMTLDEKVYADPFAFNLARYLPRPAGSAEPHPSGPFGFGRRICPGRHLADASLWIAMASILATLDISKAVGNDGRTIVPEVSFTSGISSHPRPYRCSILPRNKAAHALIAQSEVWDTD